MRTTETKFDPRQYAIDRGWDFYCILDTAHLGVSVADAEALTEQDSDALLAWCKEQAILIPLDITTAAC